MSDFGFDSKGEDKVNNPAPIDNGQQPVSIDEPVDSLGNPIVDNPDDKIKRDTKQTDEPKKNPVDGDNKPKQDDKSAKTDKTNDTKSLFTEGAVVEVGDESYTVDKDGNLLSKDGKIFKEAKDVDEWLKEFDVKEDAPKEGETEISIDNIKDAIGIEITDDNDNPIEFDNTPEGIASYVNAVIETAKEEHSEAVLNTLYQKYPILQDVLNYYIANGNSLEGFNEVPDRSNITIDATNESQQENIIKMAWHEQNRKGDVNAYIQYLKSSGTLLAVAQEELKGIQEADAQYKKELEEEADRIETEKIGRLEQYWNGVHNVIKSRNIAGYTIPENIIIERNGAKLSVTPEDFFNYIYRVDDEGHSAYEKDLAEETPESRRDDEILRAYLKFVGGNYSNLVDMAISKEKVNKLRLTAKQRQQSTVKVRKPATTEKVNSNFGY